MRGETLILQVRYRDVEWESARCKHLVCLISEEVSREHWKRLRGKPVTIDTGDFRKGICDGCDQFGVMPDRRFVVVRQNLELGD